MKKWNLIIDLPKCNNCNNCTMALRDEYSGNAFPGYAEALDEAGRDWLVIDRHVRGNEAMVDVTYQPRTCNHCDNAPCMAVGGDAIKKRPDGIVVIDPVKAKGRRDIVAACPYAAIVWNEKLQIPQHWNFDAHLLDAGWNEPRITQACPTGALVSVRISDAEMAEKAKSENLATLMPELDTRPRVYYHGLARITEVFLGGNVMATGNADSTDNISGATIELTLKSSGDTYKATTDAFGDFKIDGLPKDAGDFILHAHHPQFGSGDYSGSLNSRRYLGSIELKL